MHSLSGLRSLDVLQIMVIMAGLLPDVATSVAVMGVSFDITTITYMLPSGISGMLFPPSNSPILLAAS